MICINIQKLEMIVPRIFVPDEQKEREKKKKKRNEKTDCINCIGN